MLTSNERIIWDSCYLCGNKSITNVYDVRKIVKCNKCKFVFFSQVPSDDDLNKVYSKYTRKEYITEQSKLKIRSEFSFILKNNTIKNVLDIACGECYMLEILRDLQPSLSLHGTEHESAKDNLNKKNISFLEGGFYPQTNEKFDLIIFTEAIEHINDVNDFLKNAYKLLNKNGLIYLTTPNFNSVERFFMQSNWGMIMPPEHLSYFSTQTLNMSLTKNGFKKIKLRTENISIYRIIEFYNRRKFSKTSPSSISAQDISDKMQNVISQNIFLKIAKNVINYFLKITNSGSSIKGLYQKVESKK
jgi:2-polyprenyl-3-methyl-5-hydroxy-6-metoxy-1,4-benzoquinol methylase